MKVNFRKMTALLLALLLCIGLCACGGTTDAETKVKNYITENGKVGNLGTYIELETGLKDTAVTLAIKNEALMLIVEHTVSAANEAMNLDYITNLYISGDKSGEFAQQNTVKVKSKYTSNTVRSTFTGNIDISAYMPDTELNGEFSSTLDSATLTDDIKAYASDGINTGIEAFASFLNEKLGLTLENIGFSKYKIDSERVSAIKEHNSEPEKPKAAPAPITITVYKFEEGIDSLSGDPMLYYKLTNNSDRAIEACTIYILCYDGYGDMMKQFGYGSEGCSVQIGKRIEPGETIEWGNQLSGYEDAKSVKLAAAMYKLEGEEKVIIATENNAGSSDLVWTKYPA